MIKPRDYFLMKKSQTIYDGVREGKPVSSSLAVTYWKRIWDLRSFLVIDLGRVRKRIWRSSDQDAICIQFVLQSLSNIGMKLVRDWLLWRWVLLPSRIGVRAVATVERSVVSCSSMILGQLDRLENTKIWILALLLGGAICKESTVPFHPKSQKYRNIIRNGIVKNSINPALNANNPGSFLKELVESNFTTLDYSSFGPCCLSLCAPISDKLCFYFMLHQYTLILWTRGASFGRAQSMQYFRFVHCQVAKFDGLNSASIHAVFFHLGRNDGAPFHVVHRHFRCQVDLQAVAQWLPRIEVFRESQDWQSTKWHCL